MQKPSASREFEKDYCAPRATFLDDESAMRESLLSTDLSSTALDGSNDKHGEMLLTMDAQGIGIT